MADEAQQQDEGQDVTDNNDNVKEEPKEQVEAPAESSESADEANQETPSEQTEETSEEAPTQDEEEFDINNWYNEHYGVNAEQAQEQDDGKSFADRLASLQADEEGTVSPEEAGKAFEEEWNRREQRILERARQEAMGIRNEEQELRRVLERYPQVKKNRKLFDVIANHRDASALRGQGLSLVQAADEIIGLTKEERAAGAKSAKRTQEIQASAHLETSGVKGNSDASRLAELRQVAASPNREKAAAARRALLRESIEKGHLKLGS